MVFIYDLLLNFTDYNRLLEFYEWDSKDGLEHIKKIPLFKIKSIDMDNIINSNIKVSKIFLDKINNQTIGYRKKNNIKYGCLFCDLNKVVGVEFNKDGKIISRSSLLLDEEEDIIDEISILEDYDFTYKIINKYNTNSFLTRKEMLRRKYLLKELNKIYKDKYYDKFNYLYEEVFGNNNKSISDKYEIIINDIKNNYNNKYNKLYEIVRLSYQKNRLH